jgi:hypothetical protein
MCDRVELKRSSGEGGRTKCHKDSTRSGAVQVRECESGILLTAGVVQLQDLKDRAPFSGSARGSAAAMGSGIEGADVTFNEHV